MVITLAQQKGGAGKTTLAANLAVAFAAARRSVAVLDTDPQRSLARWVALRNQRREQVAPIGFSDLSGWRLRNELERIRALYDVLIVDSPPQIQGDARAAVRAADLVLVPVQPSPPDLWAAEGTLALAAEEKRKVALVLNRVPASSRLRASVEADIARRSLPLLRATLGNRTGFAGAFALGLGITETAPRSLGAAELHALVSEIEEVLL
jgi:chromosome partitioning protein